MAQYLRELAVLPKDQGLVPRIQVRQLRIVFNSSSRVLTSLAFLNICTEVHKTTRTHARAHTHTI